MRKLDDREIEPALRGAFIVAASKRLDDDGYPMVELLLRHHGGYETVSFVADGYHVSDLIVRVER